MELKPGYKQTAIGVIPDDWRIVLIGDIGSFSKGKGIKKDQTTSGDIPCIRYGEIYTLHDNVIRRFYSFISQEVAKTSTLLKNGDIVFAGSGETRAEIGKSAAYISSIQAYAGGDIVILSPQEENSVFLGYLFNGFHVVKQKSKKGQGDAIVHISARSIADILIPLPTLKEQRAIASALSDVDALIESLDRLIAKKRDIKQAATQELLTGKTRLPGYGKKGRTGYKQTEVGVIPDDWECKSLDFVSTMKSGQGITAELINDQAQYPCYGGNGIRGYTATYTHDGTYALIGRQGALCGNITSVDGKFFASEHAVVVTPSQKTDIRFLTYVLSRMQLNRYSESSAQPGLSVSKILKLPLAIPSTLKEQTAIASVLSDMDAEIEELEKRRAKTADLKQGMMQELLTGRTRLVQPEIPHV